MKRSSLHRIRRLSLRAGLAASGLALLATPASAQFRASIQGTVTDSTGGVIPNASLTLTDTDNNRVITATSNDSGTYNFNALPPDNYTLTAAAKGFQTQTIQNVHLNPDQANAVNVQLPLGQATTTVDVNANNLPTLDSETASINGNISSEQIQHLPSSGRDVFSLVQLAPGVFGDGARGSAGSARNLPGSVGPGGSGTGIFQTENAPQSNVNGSRNDSNGISIDGISTVSAVWGGASVITPTEDSIGNVKVIANGYDAENGRFSGAQVQLTSKTGTNDFHGSAFFRAYRPGLNAYQRYNGADTFNAGTPADRQLLRDNERANQIGGSIGGPIWKDKVFAFFAYETQRDNSAATTTAFYETAALRALAPAGSVAATYLGFPGEAPAASGAPGGTCAGAGLNENPANGPVTCHTVAGGLDIGSPLKTARGTQDATYQSVQNPGQGSGFDGSPDIALYTTANPTQQTASQYNGRLDANIGGKDHVAFAIYWVPLTRTNYNGPVRAQNIFHHNQINDAYSGIWNHTFSPSFLNEARVNDAGYRWNEVASNPQAPFGLPFSQVDPFGSLTGTNQLSSFGAPGVSNLNQHSYTFKDVATRVIGNHTLKFGGELDRIYYLNNNVGGARPSYTFYNIWNFLNDAPHSETGTFDPATGIPTTNRQDTRTNIWGGFVQDAWKAMPNLTLNFGVRYAYFGSLYSKQNNLGVLQFGSGPGIYTGASIRRGGSLTSPQTGNVGPQFGFSFAPTALKNKMVLRGGYGLNFNQTEIAILGNGGNNPPFLFNATFNNSTPTAADPHIVYATAPNPNTLFGYAPNPNAISTFNAANLPTVGGATAVAYQGRQPTVYTENFSLDTQLDLGHQLVATVGYQGSVSRHLTLNSQSYVTGFANGQAQNPLLTNIQLFANTGTANSNALLLGLKHQMSHDVQFDAEFQLARSMDTGSFPYYQDPYPYRPDLAYGRSDFNIGKAFKLNALWQPNLWHGNRFVGQALNGWSVSGIYNLHTGFPFSSVYNVSGGNLYYAASGYSNLRPTAYNGGGGSNRSNEAYEVGRPNRNFASAGANQPYFALPASGIGSQVTGVNAGGVVTTPTYTLPQLPGVSRNAFTGPGYQDVDATITKAFGIHPGRIVGEHASIEIRADAFNLFNNTNLDNTSIDTNVQSATFSQASRGLAGRTVNLQARFSF